MKKPLVSVYGAGLGIPKKKSLYMIQIRPHGVLRSSFRLVLLSDPEKAKLKDAMRCIQVGSLSQLKEFSILPKAAAV